MFFGVVLRTAMKNIFKPATKRSLLRLTFGCSMEQILRNRCSRRVHVLFVVTRLLPVRRSCLLICACASPVKNKLELAVFKKARNLKRKTKICVDKQLTECSEKKLPDFQRKKIEKTEMKLEEKAKIHREEDLRDKQNS